MLSDLLQGLSAWSGIDIAPTGLYRGLVGYQGLRPLLPCAAPMGLVGVVGRTFLEIDCWAYRNGRTSADDNNQGFTSHAGSKGIRIGCVSRDSKGPNFHDVTGSLVLMYGCTGYKSRAAGTKNADFAIGVDGSDASQVWLVDCVSAEGQAPSLYSAYAFTSGSGRLYERNFTRGKKADTLVGVVTGYL